MKQYTYSEFKKIPKGTKLKCKHGRENTFDGAKGEYQGDHFVCHNETDLMGSHCKERYGFKYSWCTSAMHNWEFEEVSENSDNNKTLSKEELIAHIKENGITLCQTTGNNSIIKKGTKLYFGLISSGKLSTYSREVDGLNIKFGYDFDYEWISFWEDEKLNESFKVLGQAPNEHEEVTITGSKYKVGEKVRVIDTRCNGFKDRDIVTIVMIHSRDSILVKGVSKGTGLIIEQSVGEHEIEKLGRIIDKLSQYLGKTTEALESTDEQLLKQHTRVFNNYKIKEKIMLSIKTIPSTIKRVLSPELTSQYKADYINGDLALTERGQAVLMEVMQEKFEKELAQKAEEEIKEFKKNKKD